MPVVGCADLEVPFVLPSSVRGVPVRTVIFLMATEPSHVGRRTQPARVLETGC